MKRLTEMTVFKGSSAALLRQRFAPRGDLDARSAR